MKCSSRKECSQAEKKKRDAQRRRGKRKLLQASKDWEEKTAPSLYFAFLVGQLVRGQMEREVFFLFFLINDVRSEKENDLWGSSSDKWNLSHVRQNCFSCLSSASFRSPATFDVVQVTMSSPTDRLKGRKNGTVVNSCENYPGSSFRCCQQTCPRREDAQRGRSLRLNTQSGKNGLCQKE